MDRFRKIAIHKRELGGHGAASGAFCLVLNSLSYLAEFRPFFRFTNEVSVFFIVFPASILFLLTIFLQNMQRFSDEVRARNDFEGHSAP